MAKKLNIKISELNRKLEGEKEFLANEASAIANIFELTIQDFADIFFSPKNRKKEPLNK